MFGGGLWNLPQLETARSRYITLEVGKLGRKGKMEYSMEIKMETRSGKRWSVTSGVIDL